MATDQRRLCEYGCGREAKFSPRKGMIKWCCSEFVSQCPEILRKNRKGNKDKLLTKDHKQKIGKSNKGKIRSKKHKEEARKARIKYLKTLTKEEKSKIFGRKLSIKQIKKRYPFFYKIEKPQHNPDNPEEIQVHCKYNKCENSKEQGGWFTPTLIQLQERIRQIEKDCGNGGSYLYCSDNCKYSCKLYQGPNPNKESEPQSREVQPELRELRLEIDDYACQKCGKTIDEIEVHCHHIEGIRWEPLQSADLDMVITFCKDCHKVVHQIEGCRYIDMKCNLKEKHGL